MGPFKKYYRLDTKCVVSKERKWKTANHILNMFRWIKENLRDTLVHEMIHPEIGDYMERVPWWKRLFHKDHDQWFKKGRMNKMKKMV